MAENPEQLQRHIEVLTRFEQKYGEFLAAVHDEWAGNDAPWTPEEHALRKREIQSMATRADNAMKASGVGQYVIGYPPMLGGGIKSTDLPSQVFDFAPSSPFSEDDGLNAQRAILDRIPSQISGLEVLLENTERGSEKLDPSEAASVQTEAQSGDRSMSESWVNHPWTIAIFGGIVATVAGGVIATAIIAITT